MGINWPPSTLAFRISAYHQHNRPSHQPKHQNEIYNQKNDILTIIHPRAFLLRLCFHQHIQPHSSFNPR